MATDKSAFFEIAKELIFDFLVFFGLMKRSEAGKVTVDPEKMKEVLGHLAPHIFGIGLNDEALFNAALAKLEDRRHVKIGRFMQTLSDHDRARFILAITILPEEKDRLKILEMYSELVDTNEMSAVAKATRMISGDKGPAEQLPEEAKKVVASIWKIFKKIFRRIDKRAKKEAKRQKKTWFGKLSSALIR